MIMGTETGVTQPQAKEHLGAARSWRRQEMDPPLGPPGAEQPCVDTWILNFWPPELWGSAVLKQRVCGGLPRRPEEGTSGCRDWNLGVHWTETNWRR